MDRGGIAFTTLAHSGICSETAVRNRAAAARKQQPNILDSVYELNRRRKSLVTLPESMDQFFIWLEATPLSIWVRESTSVMAFPAILSAHAIGMGLAAGINSALALRLLGAAARVPVRELQRFVPLMWFGFWLNAASGVLLLVGYPTKALTNPVFYLKLSFIALALWTYRMTSRRVFGADLKEDADEPDEVAVGGTMVGVVARQSVKLKTLAVVTLASWAGAVTAGRLLAYTYRRLMASW